MIRKKKIASGFVLFLNMQVVSIFHPTYKILVVVEVSDEVGAVVIPVVRIDFGIDKLLPLLALVDDAVIISKNKSIVRED